MFFSCHTCTSVCKYNNYISIDVQFVYKILQFLFFFHSIFNMISLHVDELTSRQARFTF
jgi:hypothetical protein